MDCLLISPDSSREAYQALAGEYAAIETPTWALLIAGALRMEFSIDILDPLAEKLTDDEAVERVLEARPRFVCFVVYGQNPNSGTTNMAGAERLARRIREQWEGPIVFIGSHPSAMPDVTACLPYVDHVLPGDGVNALRSLLRQGAGPAVMWGKPVETFSGHAWDMLPSFSNYRAHFWHGYFDAERTSRSAALYTSLGCTFKCEFCMINLVNRSSEGQRDASESSGMRFLDAGVVLSEMEYLAERGVRNVRISDEMFFLNRRHYAPIVRGLVERNLGLNMWAYARVDTVRYEFLEDFKRAGINWLALGIEAGNLKIRREASKGSFVDADVRDVVRQIQSHGINVVGNYIFGLPDDTYGSMQETLDLAMELRTEHANFYPCMALPGSPLYRRALESRTPLPATWAGYGFLSYECLPLPTRVLSAADVLEFRDEAWSRYFTDPGYIGMMEKRFGAGSSIEKQALVKVRRQLLGDVR